MPQPNEKLRMARRQRNWSQEQAAVAIGIERKTYIRWENGQNAPQPGTLDLACRAFGLSAVDLGFIDDVQVAPENGTRELSLSIHQQRDGNNNSLDASILLGLKVVQLVSVVNARGGQALRCGDIQAMVDRELKMLDGNVPHNAQEDYKISRRQALITLAALPTTLLLLGVTRLARVKHTLRKPNQEVTPKRLL